MNIRHADAIRNFIRDNALTSYNPSPDWDEAAAPFTTTDEPIIYCRQEGQPVDAFVTQSSVDVYLFSPVNATRTQMNTLYADAVSAYEYAKANPEVNDDIKITVSQSVTGEYYTGQNRRYYRFTVFCMST